MTFSASFSEAVVSAPALDWALPAPKELRVEEVSVDGVAWPEAHCSSISKFRARGYNAQGFLGICIAHVKKMYIHRHI